MILAALFTFAAGLPLAAPPLPVRTRRAQDTRPSAEALVNTAWLLVPTYTGEHRAFLTESEEAETRAAGLILQAALALAPDHVLGLWRLGHTQVLLAENQKNRGHVEEGEELYQRALETLSRAIELWPEDPWAFYARGAASASFGDQRSALADLDAALETANLQIERGEGSSPAWLRYKALEWRTEVLMRLGEHARARDEMRSFHAEFSSNDWPRFIALAESYLRERDFNGARDQYDQAVLGFSSDHQAYALLGYVAGLLGDQSTATARLLQALENELRPDLYPRLWLWILTTDEHRAAAEQDLRAFLQDPPDDLGAWDRRLGSFVLGGEPVEGFLGAAALETERRMAAGEALDDLMCEASFYAGLRRELDAAKSADQAERLSLRRGALEAYRAALSFSPVKWKWEWAYSRRNLAELCSELGLVADPAFAVAEGHFRSEGLAGVLLSARWHRPLSPESVASLDELRPGDLFLGTVQLEDGRMLRVHEVVGFTNGD